MKEVVSLRKFKSKDLDRIMEIFIDKDVFRGIGLDKKPSEVTRKFELGWLQKTINNYRKKKPDNHNMAIILNGEIIGSIGAHNINYNDSNLEVGYWIGKKYWSNGYTTKALKLYLKETQKKLNPVRIVAYHYIFNPASGKVMQKCGFKYEGRRRKAKKKDGKYIDDEMYALVR